MAHLLENINLTSNNRPTLIFIIDNHSDFQTTRISIFIGVGQSTFKVGTNVIDSLSKHCGRTVQRHTCAAWSTSTGVGSTPI